MNGISRLENDDCLPTKPFQAKPAFRVITTVRAADQRFESTLSLQFLVSALVASRTCGESEPPLAAIRCVELIRPAEARPCSSTAGANGSCESRRPTPPQPHFFHLEVPCFRGQNHSGQPADKLDIIVELVLDQSDFVE